MTDDQQSKTTEPRFAKPKILVIDCEPEVVQRLQNDGYSAVMGTFGRPYVVQKQDYYGPVIAKACLPNHTEQEIVVIDLTSPQLSEGPEGEKAVSYGTEDWWASKKFGFIDPRPQSMSLVQEDFDQILKMGGVFIIFCEPHLNQEIWYTTGNEYGQIDHAGKRLDLNNWPFLAIFRGHNVEFRVEQGEELTPLSGDSVLQGCLNRHLKDATFSTVLDPQAWLLDKDSGGPLFFTLFMNKRDGIVGGGILEGNIPGMVLLLPHFADKPALIHDLVTNVLPEIKPDLFPYDERTKWTASPEYEHASVLRLVAQQEGIREKADQTIAQLESQIAAERETLGFLHGILTKTGDDLVQDVKVALEALGFLQVVDADQALSEKPLKQEDLQIMDRSPTLLAEVKGLNGLPTENDALQVLKYIPRRMKEWNRTDVSGLSIINHQRALPPLNREHKTVFTNQQVEDAENHDFALATTWELFRLLRGKQAFNWPADVVLPLFYDRGRIKTIPLHWNEVGEVVHFYDKAEVVSIQLTADLKVGDRIGFDLPAEFVEEEVSSMEIDGTAVEHAAAGQKIGVKTSRKRSDLPDGRKVYLVTDPNV